MDLLWQVLDAKWVFDVAGDRDARTSCNASEVGTAKKKKRKEILAHTDDQNSTSTYWLFGRVELGVIDASTLRMSPAPFHPVDDDFKRDAQVQDYVHWLSLIHI